ncbi:GntR family transcriptional regulator [Gracilibacillus salitolerans]|uniref:GntR family transcriptional regulator n=1 Tax=Gracilibacillus salitolerans TaxID=2663022 RepID=A0A5Q2TDK7_9BACI|nr:GntR family transcriptional regulator [Gracilibacillus salitolerans]QGH32676.1 GntR family transcriptional regulator [Gracilibacillus salitolerans]
MKSLYEQIYESLKQDIISAKYKVGDQVPSEKELSEYFNVSTITTKKALEKLTHEGFVYRKRGKGTFVSKNTIDMKIVKHDVQTKKPLFGLILTTFDDSFGNKLIASLEEASQDECFIILRRSLSIPNREDKVIRELLEYGIDGLIISPAKAEHYSLEILKMIVNQFPLVLIDRSFKGLATTSVSTDNEQAAKMGINHLLELGHENIGILIPKDNGTTTIEDRIKGIVEATAEKKVIVNRDLWCSDIKSPYPTHADTKKDIEVIMNHIKKNRNITALFALEYNIAVLAKQAVEQLKLKIPEDISILCFDSPPRNALEWNFTHLQQNEEEIGRLALNNLLEMYNGNFIIDDIRVSATLIEGDTTIKNSFTRGPTKL